MPDMIVSLNSSPPSPMSGSSTSSSAFPPAEQRPTVPTMGAENQLLGQQVDEKHDEDFFERLKVPTVILETPSISHTMAAALSLSLLSHTLFLKSQIPFPVAQLSRMPVGKSNPKVAQKREELLATIDTLASHLQTTFVALSTAHARCMYARSSTPADGQSRAIEPNSPTRAATIPRGTAHLMFVLGSSVGAARARIVFTIDGLELKIWGARGSSPEDEEEEDSESDEDTSDDEASEDEVSDEEADASEEEVSDDDEAADSSDGGKSDGTVTGSQDTERRDSDDEDDFDSTSEPPLSRSPSPSSPLTRSLAPSPESIPSPRPLPTPLDDPPPPSPFVQAPEYVPQVVMSAQPTQSIPRAPSSPPSKPVPPVPPAASASRQAAAVPHEQSHAEAQQALTAAQRLLSRTLMNAWVDGEGDMASELAPTQTHIYLRAPRRFAHPAWAARQNLTRPLDAILDAFLEDAGAVPSPSLAGSGAKGKKSKSGRVRTEGAWIGCRGGSAFAHAREGGGGRADADEGAPAHEHENEGADGKDEEDEEANEDDEEIWWTWEGKLVGFADW